jgi:hypothetical protein
MGTGLCGCATAGLNKVGRTPWSAADAHVGSVLKQVQGDPRGPGGPPHFVSMEIQCEIS